VPKGKVLEHWVDQSGLHPVTSLTTLTRKEKERFLNKRIVLCKRILQRGHILDEIGLSISR